MKRIYFLLMLSIAFLIFIGCNNEFVSVDEVNYKSSYTTSIRSVSVEEAKDSLRIQVLYFRGGKTTDVSNPKAYLKDKFFQIYNPTSVAIPVANLALLESELLTVNNYRNLTAKQDTSFLIGAAFKIPSTDTTLLQPGGKLVLCSVGKDHDPFSNPGLDLSTSDFEWFESIVSSNPNVFSEDTPVPNLKRLHTYSKTIWTPHGQGYKSFAIAYITEDTLYSIPYEYDLNLWNGKIQDSVMYHYNRNAPIINPNIIIDAVNVLGQKEIPDKEFKFNPFKLGLDRGYANIKNPLKDNTGIAIVRRDYIDTNNSCSDFKEINLNSYSDDDPSPIVDPRDPRLKSTK